MGVMKAQGVGGAVAQFPTVQKWGEGIRERTGTCFPTGCELFKIHRVLNLRCQKVQQNEPTAKGIRSKPTGDNLKGVRAPELILSWGRESGRSRSEERSHPAKLHYATGENEVLTIEITGASSKTVKKCKGMLKSILPYCQKENETVSPMFHRTSIQNYLDRVGPWKEPCIQIQKTCICVQILLLVRQDGTGQDRYPIWAQLPLL